MGRTGCVTPLAAEAVSFSGRLNVGMTDQPGPHNVDRRIHVSMRAVPACETGEFCLYFPECLMESYPWWAASGIK
jgi:hypothetical protein